MDWNIFLSFALGAIATIIPIIITNRYQSREKDKDRVEQKKEAKLQLELQLLRNDIRFLEDRIDEDLRMADSVDTLSFKNTLGELSLDSSELSRDALVKQIQLKFLDENGKYAQSGETQLISDKLAYALGDEFFSEHKKFDDLCYEFWKMATLHTYSPENIAKARLELSKSAGRLHNILKEKLISLRE